MAETRQNTEPRPKPGRRRLHAAAADARKKGQEAARGARTMFRAVAHQFDKAVAQSCPSSSVTPTRCRCRTSPKWCSTWASAKASPTAKRWSPPRAIHAHAGQKAVVTMSRKSIATYNRRAGQAIGCKVTLRKGHMYDFSTGWSTSRCRASAISAASTQKLPMSAAPTASASRNTSFSRKSISTRRPSLGPGYHRLHQRAQRCEARALLDAFNFPFRK